MGSSTCRVFSACCQEILAPLGWEFLRGALAGGSLAPALGSAGVPWPKELLGKGSLRWRDGEQTLLGSLPCSQPCPCCRRRHSTAALVSLWIGSPSSSPLLPCEDSSCDSAPQAPLPRLGEDKAAGPSWAPVPGTEAELCSPLRSGKQIPLFYSLPIVGTMTGSLLSQTRGPSPSWPWPPCGHGLDRGSAWDKGRAGTSVSPPGAGRSSFGAALAEE